MQPLRLLWVTLLLCCFIVVIFICVGNYIDTTLTFVRMPVRTNISKYNANKWPVGTSQRPSQEIFNRRTIDSPDQPSTIKHSDDVASTMSLSRANTTNQFEISAPDQLSSYKRRNDEVSAISPSGGNTSYESEISAPEQLSSYKRRDDEESAISPSGGNTSYESEISAPEQLSSYKRRDDEESAISPSGGNTSYESEISAPEQLSSYKRRDDKVSASSPSSGNTTYQSEIRRDYVNDLPPTLHNEVENRLYEQTDLSTYSVKGEPVRHIAFLKVHKAASTTVQNIFLRYGYEHNLVFVLPKGGSTISVRNTIRLDNIIPPPKSRSYDVMCSHVRFNKEAFEDILPTDTVYIGIVREPFSQFQSNLQYYHQKAVLKIPGSKPVLEYLLHNEKYMKYGGKISSTYNRMAYDFGFPDDLFWSNDKEGIQNYLLKLERDVDLVIVTDYFDESIVLMRRLLNWDLRYVLYGKLNEKKRKDPRLLLGSEEEQLYKSWAKLDYTLYQFFVKKLLEKLKQQPPDFYEELSYFRQIRKKYDQFCLSTITDDRGKNTTFFERSAWNKPFVVTRQNCKKLYIREIPFFNQLRTIQEQSVFTIP